MSQKCRDYITLSSIQKRRRLSLLQNYRNNGSEDIETPNSSLDERLESQNNLELSQRERSSDDDLHIHAPPDTDTASLVEETSSDIGETERSNEEHTDEEIEEYHIVGEYVDEEESDQNSREENQGVIVIEDSINLRKRA